MSRHLVIDDARERLVKSGQKQLVGLENRTDHLLELFVDDDDVLHEIEMGGFGLQAAHGRQSDALDISFKRLGQNRQTSREGLEEAIHVTHVLPSLSFDHVAALSVEHSHVVNDEALVTLRLHFYVGPGKSEM
jgi:hypothetical protein